MMSPEVAYKYDNSFRTVVDQMRALLSMYHITPAELRQAAILAATMHDAENIKPIFAKPWSLYNSLYEKPTYPALFGGYTVYGGTDSGRTQCSKSNFTVQDKQAGLEKDYNMLLKYNCICDYTGSINALHSQTCKDYNWEILHPKPEPEHCHTFRASGYGFDVCADCGMSDVYYNYEYNKK